MANDRIYIRCKCCGSTEFLGKSFGMGFYWDLPGEPLSKRLNRFFCKHTWCHEELVSNPPYDEERYPLPDGFEGCEGAYDIVYESGDVPEMSTCVGERERRQQP